ncbi:MAG: hypothetical protein V8S69_00885 [Dakarella massiliensis]
MPGRSVTTSVFGYPLDRAALPVDRHTREVPHVLVRPRQLVEQRRLAAVLVSRQRESQFSLDWTEVRLRVIDQAFFLTEARVRELKLPLLLIKRFHMLWLPLAADVADTDLPCILESQREFIAMQPHFDGVSHRRVFHERHPDTRNEPHIEKVLPQLPLPADGIHRRTHPDREIPQGLGCRTIRALIFCHW